VEKKEKKKNLSCFTAVAELKLRRGWVRLDSHLKQEPGWREYHPFLGPNCLLADLDLTLPSLLVFFKLPSSLLLCEI